MPMKIRFMRVEELQRVAYLIRALQEYQQLVIERIPTDQDLHKELLHEDKDSGELLPNKFGTYTAVAIDESRLHEPDYDYLIGYIMYNQNFSIIEGKQFYMTSFFVQAEYRRKGVGKQLMEFMRLHALSTGNKRVDIPYMNTNLIGQKFYKSYGSYVVNDEYNLMAMSVEQFN